MWGEMQHEKSTWCTEGNTVANFMEEYLALEMQGNKKHMARAYGFNKRTVQGFNKPRVQWREHKALTSQ